MSEYKVRLDHLLGVYRVGSGDWPWTEEYTNLIGQPDTQKLLARIRDGGIREPILLGTDGRIWDGHHRIVIAMRLWLSTMPRCGHPSYSRNRNGSTAPNPGSSRAGQSSARSGGELASRRRAWQANATPPRRTKTMT